MDNKKGGLSARYIVIFIVLIVSFGAILFFYNLAFGDTGSIDREVCHESLVFRHSLNVGPLQIGKDNIPLKCQTEKICLTNSDGRCDEDFGKSSRENIVDVVKLSDKNTKEEILDEISDSILDCNILLGEGHLNFMPIKNFEKNYCFSCAKLSFDKETINRVGEISYVELYQYMSDRKFSSKESYLHKIYGVDNPSKIGEDLQNDKFKGLDLKDLTIDLSQEQAIIAQMANEGSWVAKLRGSGTTIGAIGLGAAGVVLAPVSAGSSLGLTAISIAVVGGTISGGAVYWQTFPDNTNSAYAPPIVYPSNFETLKGLDCSFEFIP